MTTRSVFYYPVVFNRDSNSTQALVPWVNALPLNQFVSDPAVVLASDTGELAQGMYAYDGSQWRFAMPTEAISEAIIGGYALSIYYNLVDEVTLPSRAKVYKNGQLQPGDVIIPGPAIYVAGLPPAEGGGGPSAVTSVNGQTGDVTINATNLPGLSAVAKSGLYSDLIGAPTPFALDAASATVLGGVKIPTGSNLVVDSLGNLSVDPVLVTLLDGKNSVVQVGTGTPVIDSTTAGVVSLKSIIAGANMTVSVDANKNIVVASSASGALTLSGDVTGTGTGTITTELSETGVVAGTYTQVTVDAKGRVTIGANPTTLAGYGITDALNALTGGAVTGTITLGSGAGLTGLLAPVNPPDAANKAYVDAAVGALANGVSWHQSVQVATTANITLSAAQTIDGQVVAVGQRVLVKNQTAAADNGIYVVAAAAWTRATDANTGPTLLNAAVLILKGSTNGLTQWVNTNTGAITLGTTPVTFSQLQGASQVYVAGAGLALNGTTFSIASTGVVAGSYTKVTVNSQGQVTKGEQLTTTDIGNALGYTPYNGTTNPNGFLTAVPAVTYQGDVTGFGSSPVTLTLASTGITPGQYAKVTVDAKGRVTAGGALTMAEIVAAIGYVPYNGATNPNGYIGSSSPIALTGDITGTGLSSIATSLSPTGVAQGTYSKVTVDTKGRVTAGANFTSTEIVAALGYTPLNKAGDAMTGTFSFAPTVNVASANNALVGSAVSNSIALSGTTTVNTFDAAPAGTVKYIRFTGVMTLTHSATAFILPTQAPIVTAVNDFAVFVSMGGGNWLCGSYYRANGEALKSGVEGSPFATTQVFNGSLTEGAAKFKNIFEMALIVGAAPGAAPAVNISGGAVQYWTTAATSNWVPNIRFSASTTLNTALAVGDSVTVTMLVTQGATAFFPTAFQVDGAAVVPKWQGGTAPTAGNSSGIDAYNYVIIKTAAATFTVLASQTQYK